MSMILSDLPSELLISFIFPKLHPRDLARIRCANIRLKKSVDSYLVILKTLVIRSTKYTGSCNKKCFNFMTKKTTKLVHIKVEIVRYKEWLLNRHSCVTNREFFRVLKRNLNLEKIDISGFQISQKSLRQLLLCENLKSLTLFSVWGAKFANADEIQKDIENIKKKGVAVNYWPYKVRYLNKYWRKHFLN